MADDVDVLLRFCEDEWTQGRHTESQRATVTNFVVILSIGVFTFIVQKGLSIQTLPLTLLLILLGIYGAVISYKLYERWSLCRRRVRYWRNRIDELHPNAKLLELKKTAALEQAKKYPRMYKIKLYRLWSILHISIAIIGLICSIIIIARFWIYGV